MDVMFDYRLRSSIYSSGSEDLHCLLISLSFLGHNSALLLLFHGVVRRL